MMLHFRDVRTCMLLVMCYRFTLYVHVYTWYSIPYHHLQKTIDFGYGLGSNLYNGHSYCEGSDELQHQQVCRKFRVSIEELYSV